MMKAGKYYVGDLCYVMHDAWHEFCELTIEDHVCKDGQFTLKDGREFAFRQTAYGDGTYTDQLGRMYYVDAGLIGCILYDDIDFTDELNDTKGGQVIEFTEDFEVEYDSGLISFGSDLLIETDPDSDDDEYENHDWDDDEED